MLLKKLSMLFPRKKKTFLEMYRARRHPLLLMLILELDFPEPRTK